MTFDDKWVIFICLTEQYMLWPYKWHIFTIIIIIIVNIIIFWDITCPSYKLMSVAVTMTARRLILEEQIQWAYSITTRKTF